MAHSLSAATGQPGGEFEHAFSRTKFTIRSGEGGMTQSSECGGERAEERAAYAIGSGAHAYGYLIQVGDHLFQSPLSYYTNRRAWDMAPGYERSPDPDFSRPVTEECVLCHAGKPLPVRDTLNRYEARPFAAEGIGCERCHGPAAEHLRKPPLGTIVNPAKLSGAARDSVCEECHLTGEIRVPNPGKTVADYQPGRTLEDAYTIYVRARGDGQAIKVVSHSEQLARSACARNSGGKLWCGTCHDPHEAPANTVAYHRERCLSCHGATLVKSHGAPSRDCVGCHMPRKPASDGGHTVFTDHRISRRPERESESDAKGELTAWREPAARLRERNLAIALATEGMQNAAPEEAIRGYRLLNRVEKEFPDDAAVLTNLGSVLLRAKQPAEAARRFEKAASLRPDSAPYQVNAAAALREESDLVDAARRLERAVELDPLLEAAVEALARVYRDQGRDGKANEVEARFRLAMRYRQAR